MQMGFNSDIKHHGNIVHIQTEDQGINAAKIETQVFFSGTILDSRILSYSELVEDIDDEDSLAEEVKRRMKALHKYFHNQIQRGTYDHLLPREDGEAKPAKKESRSEAPAKQAASDDTSEEVEEVRIPPIAGGTDGEHAAFLGIANVSSSALGDALIEAMV